MRIFYLTAFVSALLFSCTERQGEEINLSELTIQQIHRAYKTKEYTAQELVQAYLDRISKNDSVLNAITQINPLALERAKVLDKEFSETGVLRPLHGIPFIVKDNINTIGLPTTAGSKALKNYYPEANAPIIQQLEEAGAIIIAKSNMAEWAFSPMHSESSTGGTTYNPYNFDYVPAGSSGGTAAAVSSNFGTVGLGTDTGNSIRGPSSHCGLVGFRTTLGLISRSGIVPLFLRNDVVGPMCRTVEDATRVMEVMVGVDPSDAITEYSKGKAHADYQQFLDENGLKGARIGVLRELSEFEVDPEISVLFDESLKDMNSLGAEIVDPIVVPRFAELRQNQWCSTFKQDLETFLTEYVQDSSLQTIEDIIAVGSDSEFAASRLISSAEFQGRWGELEIPCADAYTDSLRIAFRSAIEMMMDSLQLDAIVYPTWNNRPARIDQFQEEYKGDNNQIIAPHTGQPAFTVPMGYTSLGLPAGLQFLGRMYSEPTLVKLSYAYEQGTLHRITPELP